MSRWDGMQVVKKSYNGVRIGYIVGWWTNTRGWRRKDITFRSFREGVIFKRESDAVAYRDNIEKMREGNTGVKFEKVKDKEIH